MGRRGRFPERTRGVTLRMLDFGRQAAAVKDKAQADLYAKGDTRFGQVEVRLEEAPYAMAEKDGHLYVVGREGVGMEVTDDDWLEIGVYLSFPDGFDMMPRYQLSLGPNEIRAAASTVEVDLADLIREFGQRLEDNFWLWHRTLAVTVDA